METLIELMSIRSHCKIATVQSTGTGSPQLRFVAESAAESRFSRRRGLCTQLTVDTSYLINQTLHSFTVSFTVTISELASLAQECRAA
jgi:hypothetical protein